ncbi:MAG: septal ring lytic transglycosylase RlpA family protein [Motiliproteus sp.]|nr:septal ring lytic transglycosylase RlpA family protein [Motiliproteus sp.]
MIGSVSLKAAVAVLVSVFIVVLLSGCAGSGKKGRYSIDQDHGPKGNVDLSQVPDAVPKVEPKSRGGNKSKYSVWGKTYYVLPSSDGYRKIGEASWYGKKFHGHKTANGEVYDMYAMSAAHKSLPLPTYVRVTNVKNGRQVIVRVNDRGPFHGARLIDLSYAAAYKLDMLRTGTAKVEIEAINPSTYSATKLSRKARAPDTIPVAEPVQPAKATETLVTAKQGRYLQVGAYSSWASAQSVKTQLQTLFSDLSVIINKFEGTKTLYRVQMGPVDHLGTLNGLYNVLKTAGFEQPRLVDLP